MHDIVIIGAGCAGLTAAIYARRAGKSVIVLERESIGGQISHAPKVENFPAFLSISGIDFSNRLFEQIMALEADFEIETVTGISKTAAGFTVHCEQSEYSCKNVIIATGLTHRLIGLEEEERFIGKGISYCTLCDGAFYKDKDVAVVGGGNAALQNARYLSSLCSKVFLIHRRDVFRAEARLAEEVSSLPNVEIIMNSTVKKLDGVNELEGILLLDTKTLLKKSIKLDALFISIGHVAQNEIFADLIELDQDGFILTNESCETSCKGIFAAGDCRKKAIRQLTTAAADGAIAAGNIV